MNNPTIQNNCSFSIQIDAFSILVNYYFITSFEEGKQLDNLISKALNNSNHNVRFVLQNHAIGLNAYKEIYIPLTELKKCESIQACAKNIAANCIEEYQKSKSPIIKPSKPIKKEKNNNPSKQQMNLF